MINFQKIGQKGQKRLKLEIIFQKIGQKRAKMDFFSKIDEIDGLKIPMDFEKIGKKWKIMENR